MNNQCLFCTIACRFTGCDMQFERRFQENHEDSCKQKEVNCKYCGDVIKVFNEQVGRTVSSILSILIRLKLRSTIKKKFKIPNKIFQQRLSATVAKKRGI